MNTPVFDFLKEYEKKKALRLHMPAHKGKGPLGVEALDITEIHGADVLYRESGILAESQRNATLLFQTKKTLYSAEGSTLAIRAMLFLVRQYAEQKGEALRLAAARGAHRAFFTSCAFLDVQPDLIYPSEHCNIMNGTLSKKDVEAYLDHCQSPPHALYLTSPDYLGNLAPLREIAAVCKARGILLLVDQAHGAYLNFLSPVAHAISLGADLCCDSAHKTLPVLTGGAYLHVSKSAPSLFADGAEAAMALFASTSPNYLILASLDRCNLFLEEEIREKLRPLAEAVFHTKKELRRVGYDVVGDEPLKISLRTKTKGYFGEEIAQLLRRNGVECECSDPDHLILMPSVNNDPWEIEKVAAFLSALPTKEPILRFPPKIRPLKQGMTCRQAIFSPWEEIPTKTAIGRILSSPAISFPPAVPIVVCGEILDEEAVEALLYYGVTSVCVTKEKSV